jgi:hypothetical protein
MNSQCVVCEKENIEVTCCEVVSGTFLANVSSVMNKLTSRSLLGKFQTNGGEIKAEKDAYFTDFECKVENCFMMWGKWFSACSECGNLCHRVQIVF